MKKGVLSPLVFLVMKIRKNIKYMYQKNVVKKHIDLLLIGNEDKRNYVLIKDFSTFMHNHIWPRGRKIFCRHCLQAFSAKEILKRRIKDCFKINGKQRIKKGEYVRFKNHERKIKLPFMIYVDFKSILVPKDNGKTKCRRVL